MRTPRPSASKIGAVVAIVAGASVLAVDIHRSVTTGSFDLWVWGPIGLLAVVFGGYELFFAKDDAPRP